MWCCLECHDPDLVHVSNLTVYRLLHPSAVAAIEPSRVGELLRHARMRDSLCD